MFSLKENVKWFNESLFVKASYKMVILLYITILFIIYIYIYYLIYIILYILFIVYYIYIYIYIYIIKGASQSFPPCKNVTVFLCIFAVFIYFRESLDSLSKMWGEKW